MNKKYLNSINEYPKDTMKYQKSMMKIMENLLDGKEKTIDVLIKNSKTGRNSSFEALDFLKKIGFVNINELGNQRMVSLVKNNQTFQFKYYLDSLSFKSLDSLIQLILNLLVLDLTKKNKIKFGVIFGSVLKKNSFNDLDILLVGENLTPKDLKSLDEVKKKLELFSGIVLNFHLGKSNFENISKGVVFYQSSYIFNLDDIQKQYLEFFEIYFEGIFGKKTRNLFDLALLNLSYVYCKLNDFSPKTKEEAKSFFSKKYKVTAFSDLNKRGIQIGKKVFN